MQQVDVVDTMRLERERLSKLLPRFDSIMRKTRWNNEQEVINKVEALQDEQRQAMDEHSKILRQKRANTKNECAKQEEEESLENVFSDMTGRTWQQVKKANEIRNESSTFEQAA